MRYNYQDIIILAMEKINWEFNHSIHFSVVRIWAHSDTFLFVSIWVSHLSGLKTNAIVKSLPKTHSAMWYSTLGHAVSSSRMCVQCGVSSQQQQQAASDWELERLPEESGSGDGMAQLCHLAGALLQNRLFFHFPLLCSQLKVIGTNVPSKHSVDAHTAYLFFFIWPFYCSVLHWF